MNHIPVPVSGFPTGKPDPGEWWMTTKCRKMTEEG